jgi:hypothetical protein
MNKMFFSQHMLDSLIEEGKIRLEQNTITILSHGNPSFELEPAIRFIKTADGRDDPHGLVGQIKYARDLKTMHAEVYLDSVLHMDVPYEVESGYIGEKKELLDRLSDADLLARGLLENLF